MFGFQQFIAVLTTCQAYSNLWDDVTKQFMSHSAPVVLSGSVATIRHMMDATSLSNMNSMKILELEEELSTTLRDTIKGRDELDIATFSEDEITALGATCARLATLAGTRDMTSWMEEDEGGKQSSAWDIISALAERGKLGYREEGTVRIHVFTTSPNFPGLTKIWLDGRPSITSVNALYHLESKRPDECR